MIRFIKYAIKTFLIVLIIPITNYNIDYHNSKSFNRKFVEDLIKNDSIFIIENLSEYGIIKSRIENINKFNQKKGTFVLGSSRSMQFGKPVDRCVENLTMSGSGLDEIKSIYSLLKKQEIQIDTLYIEISPWLLNPSIPGHKNWNNDTRDFSRNLKKMFSLLYFIENLNPYKYSLNKNSEDYLLRYSDGTIKYPQKYILNKNSNTIKNYAIGEVYKLQGFNHLRKIDVTEFNNFISYIKKDAIFIYFLKQPYHPLINDAIIKKYPLIRETDSLISKLSLLFNIKIIGSFYPERVNLADSHYYDAMHLTPEGLKKLIQFKK